MTQQPDATAERMDGQLPAPGGERFDRPGPGAEAEDRPGDPVCWLRRVCPACGTLAAVDPPTTCANCRADIPAE
jgi:hypothetical protein